MRQAAGAGTIGCGTSVRPNQAEQYPVRIVGASDPTSWWRQCTWAPRCGPGWVALLPRKSAQ
eukprot:11405159-Prorocentrum_lima.AAC.1